jgi:hypothetical protein
VLKEGDPSIPYEQEQAKKARFYEAILSMVSVDSMANAAKEIFGEDLDGVGEIELPPEVEYTLTSWLEVSDEQSSESLSTGVVKELLGKTFIERLRVINQQFDEHTRGSTEIIGGHGPKKVTQSEIDALLANLGD